MTVPNASHSLGLLALSNDVQVRRIPDAQRSELVEQALHDGRCLAQRAYEQWGTDPSVIAGRCNLPIIESPTEAGFGSTVIYAEYAARPPCITLYAPAIRRLDMLIAKQSRIDWGIERTTPIFVAHELYHHFDLMRGKDALIRRHRINIVTLGRWTWNVGLSTLPEIAAGAFVQQLLGLPFHPKLFDVLLTHLTPTRGHVTDEVGRLRAARLGIVSHPGWLRQRRVDGVPPRSGEGALRGLNALPVLTLPLRLRGRGPG